MTDDERRLLERRLASARRRLVEATPHSPDWDAAAEAVEELEALAREAGIPLDDGRPSLTVLRPVG
jgi:hypothetical protein